MNLAAFNLPIDETLPAVRAALSAGPAVLQAPPGAGKTTAVPLAVLDQPWLAGQKIIVLEPRRLAARAAARRMAQMLGERVGETVGYRVRLDSKVGPATRIEVVTDGLFLRRLQGDPELAGVGLVIFDEFHERGLDANLSLALCLEARAALRPDLRLLVMSATLDGGPVANLLGNAPVLTSAGRAFPVETRHWDDFRSDRVDDRMAAAIRRALAQDSGSILAFLPGEGEIRRVEAALAGLPGEILVAPLFGNLPQAEQDRAIEPAPSGQRKVVLATSIAETSLTIEGIRVVIDSGWSRQPRFDPASGMSRLETLRVTAAAADQRRGRAGRLEPGVCIRLWSAESDRALLPFDVPEIRVADLAPLALELAQWGTTASDLAWLDPPPAAALAEAQALLRRLGALDGEGRITAHGRDMAGFGAHPRLAHLMIRGRDMGCPTLACTVAALLSERDGSREVDLHRRVEALRGGRIREQARLWRRQLGGEDRQDGDVGRLVAQAYPDRIAQARGGAGQYRLSGGRGAVLDPADPLAARPLLAVAQLGGVAKDKGGADSKIFLAAALDPADFAADFADQIETVAEIGWNPREEAVEARRRRRFGALVLKEEPIVDLPPEQAVAALCAGVRAMGLGCLPWTPETDQLRARAEFARRHGEDLPDFGDDALLAELENWLAPFARGMTRRAHLRNVPLMQALKSRLDWQQQQTLDRMAPETIVVPTGSHIRIDYAAEGGPVLAVRLQELFGLAETPHVGGVPVLLHLLSPGHKPVQMTRDLAGFWTGSYAEVKRDLKGRYPRHYWPDNPLEAEPTRRAKPRGT